MGKVSRRRAIELMVGLPLAVVGLATVLDRVVAPLLPGPTLPAGGGATVDELLAAARKACGAPGIGAAILAPLDKVAIHVAGHRERGGEAPVLPDDPWHLGSDGKAMTAAVYARLVEQGRARWGAVVPELFPDLAGAVDPAWRRTTIEDLLAHRGGVTDGPLRFRLLPMHFDGRPADVQRTGLVRLVLGSPPAGDPGAFAYANLSYVIAGAAIERAAGLPFEAATAREAAANDGAQGPAAIMGPLARRLLERVLARSP